MTDTDKPVAVTQADEDLADWFIRRMEGWRGERNYIARLLARHREQAERDTIAGSAGEIDVEGLGDALAALSAKLLSSGFLESSDNHAIYEKVVAEFQSLSTPPTPGIDADRVSVPRKPTEAMYLAAFESSPWDGSGPIRRVVDEVWDAMLLAALSPKGDA